MGLGMLGVWDDALHELKLPMDQNLKDPILIIKAPIV